MNPLKTVASALITGLILMVVISLALPGSSGLNLAGLDRWLHVVSGVFWIGLLYYFNVVQIPGLAAGLADKGGPGNAGIVKYIAPRALLWFRWGAVVTVLSGVMLMEFAYRPAGASMMKALSFAEGFETISLGGWLGIIMLLNVWVFIWPNQKKVIGVVPATDEEKAKARATATMVSRINFVLSIPMLMAMTAQSHGLPF
ncbi:MAG: urate hydroxylase PuuD [Gammaproteobacteria bacterium]|nr:urate hydroxylase PuuD [Gammaproteobacteria bacterium]